MRQRGEEGGGGGGGGGGEGGGGGWKETCHALHILIGGASYNHVICISPLVIAYFVNAKKFYITIPLF